MIRVAAHRGRARSNNLQTLVFAEVSTDPVLAQSRSGGPGRSKYGLSGYIRFHHFCVLS